VVQPQPHQCPRCGASAFVRAQIESAGGGVPRVVMTSGEASPLATLVCTACGHVQMFATEPHALRGATAPAEAPPPQEFDF
jgi:predicted nucleic-acid-binding Zn-ribbon protein